jgi:hypothetical protein
VGVGAMCEMRRRPPSPTAALEVRVWWGVMGVMEFCGLGAGTWAKSLLCWAARKFGFLGYRGAKPDLPIIISGLQT